MSIKKTLRFLSIILIALFFTGALPWRELRADANIHGDYNCDRLSVTYDQVSTWDVNTQGEFVITNTSEEIVDGWTIKFDFVSDVNITSIWNGQDLRNESTSANTLIIGNEVYNSVIAPGASVSFGLIMTGSEFAPVAPLSVELMQIQEEIITEPEITVEEQLATDPSSCVIFTGRDITISGWRTTIHGDIYAGSNFNFQGSELSVDGIVKSEGIVNISGYSSVITGTEENAIHVDIPDLSEDILAGEHTYSDASVDISTQTIEGSVVVVSEGDITINVDTISEGSNIILYSVNGDITVNGNQNAFAGIMYAPNGNVIFNANEVTIAGKIVANEFIFNGSVLTVTNNPEDIPEITPEHTVTVTPTPTDVPVATVTPVPTATPTPVEDEEEPTPTPEPIDENLDSDGDYIPDYMEIEIGTNPNDPDSDGDGLNDYIELMIGYDPTKQDTDDNGILDGDEDLDSDGLCNINEIRLETDISSPDTDGDRLLDGEEVYTYGTDPKNPDSDTDGIYDGDEVALGKNPMDSSDANVRVEQTKVQEITNEEDPAITSVEVTMELSNSIDKSLKIRDMYNVDVYCTGVAGRIGSPISFECEEDFDTATVKIHYSEAALGDTNESDLGVLWFDEANGVFVKQEQAILDSSNNTITLVLEHFSEYILVDLNLFNNAMPRVYTVDDQYDVEPTHYNVTFAVDTSSYMDANEREEAINAVNAVLRNLESGDRVSICTQNGTHISYSRFVDAPGMPALAGINLSNIRNHQGSGRGNLYAFNEAAEQNFFNCRLPDDGNVNIIIFITDSNSIYSDNLSGVRLMIEHRYMFYTVFTGDSYNADIADICSRHGGGTCQAGSEEASRIILHGNEGEFIWTDEDGDGLPDILEEEGMMTRSGAVYYSNPSNPDTDGDTLTDGEEMGTMYSIRRADEDTVQIGATQIEIDEIGSSEYAWAEVFIPENPGEICFVFDVQSNPNNPDSDGDYYFDSNDEHPFDSDVRIVDLGGGRYDPFVNHEFIGVYGYPEASDYAMSYGGDQDWFGIDTGRWGDDAIELGANHLRDNYIDPHGCGLISYNDFLLYLRNGISTYSYDEYYNYIHQAYEDMLFAGGITPWGVFYPRMGASLAGYILLEKGEFLLWNWRTLDLNSPDSLLTYIEDMLNRNYPVIMSVNTIDLSDASSVMLWYYAFQHNTAREEIFADSGYSLSRKSSARGHYFTVTGIIYDRDEVYLRVSNDANEQYVIYSEYVDYVEAHGVIANSSINPGNAILYFYEV